MAYRNPRGRSASIPSSADGRQRNVAAAERFGRNVFLARRQAGYSQEQLAARCFLHRTHISLIESGRRLPRIDTFMKLVGALEIGADKLLRGLEQSPEHVEQETTC
jgi:transcriptional regulator with XRE-family HTH domain